QINLMVGFPGETEEDLEETINFIKRNRENIDRTNSVNTCNALFSSDLMNHKENYGIILSDKPKLLEVSWYTADGNCDKMRKDRVHKVVLALHELEIPIGQTNLFVVPS
ncbi:unnamed protein product, partial [marine sediment metagenome]